MNKTIADNLLKFLPEEVINDRAWLVMQIANGQKLPLNATKEFDRKTKAITFASSNKPETWTGFKEANFYLEAISYALPTRDYTLAYVLNSINIKGRLLVVDADGHGDDPVTIEKYNDVVKGLLVDNSDTYVEKSVSAIPDGKGLHILRYSLDDEHNWDDYKNAVGDGVQELFYDNKIIALTGHCINHKKVSTNVEKTIEYQRDNFPRKLKENKPLPLSIKKRTFTINGKYRNRFMFQDLIIESYFELNDTANLSNDEVKRRLFLDKNFSLIWNGKWDEAKDSKNEYFGEQHYADHSLICKILIATKNIQQTLDIIFEYVTNAYGANHVKGYDKYPKDIASSISSFLESYRPRNREAKQIYKLDDRGHVVLDGLGRATIDDDKYREHLIIELGDVNRAELVINILDKDNFFKDGGQVDLDAIKSFVENEKINNLTVMQFINNYFSILNTIRLNPYLSYEEGLHLIPNIYGNDLQLGRILRLTFAKKELIGYDIYKDMLAVWRDIEKRYLMTYEDEMPRYILLGLQQIEASIFRAAIEVVQMTDSECILNQEEVDKDGKEPITERDLELTKIENEINKFYRANIYNSHKQKRLIGEVKRDNEFSLSKGKYVLPFYESGVFNCQNGILKFDKEDNTKFEFIPHCEIGDNKFGITNISNFVYDPNANECRTFNGLLEQMFNADEREVFLKTIASIFLRTDSNHEIKRRLFFLYSKMPGTGKTTIQTALGKLFRSAKGKVGGYHSVLNKKELEENNKNSQGVGPEIIDAFATGALLTTISEMNSTSFNTSLVKSFIGGGSGLSVRNNFAKSTQLVEVNSLIIIDTNVIPAFDATEESFTSKLRIIPVRDYVPEKRDPDLINKIIAEGSGILNLILSYLPAIVQDQDILETPAMKALKESAGERDYVLNFVEECLAIDKNNKSIYTPTRVVLQIAQNYCKDLGVKIARNTIKAKLDTIFEVKRKGSKSEVERCYMSVGINPLGDIYLKMDEDRVTFEKNKRCHLLRNATYRDRNTSKDWFINKLINPQEMHLEDALQTYKNYVDYKLKCHENTTIMNSEQFKWLVDYIFNQIKIKNEDTYLIAHLQLLDNAKILD